VVWAAGAIGRARATVAADKAYDTRDFVATLRALGVTPHVAQNTTHRRSAIDTRTTRHPGYVLSQRARKRVERSSAGSRRWRCCGRRGIGRAPAWLDGCLRAGGLNLVRIRYLTWTPA
jgi:hypothetical protein